MAAAGKWKVYEQAKLELGQGSLDLSTGTFKVALFQSTSNANTLSGSNKLADLTNEVANANGYTTGGVALTGVTWTNLAGTETLGSGNAVWTAAGGAIAARFAVLYKLGTFGGIVNPIIGVCLLDTAPADASVADGQQLQVTVNAAGILTLSGATTD
jgi:hypothetical protein